MMMTSTKALLCLMLSAGVIVEGAEQGKVAAEVTASGAVKTGKVSVEVAANGEVQSLANAYDVQANSKKKTMVRQNRGARFDHVDVEGAHGKSAALTNRSIGFERAARVDHLHVAGGQSGALTNRSIVLGGQSDQPIPRAWVALGCGKNTPANKEPKCLAKTQIRHEGKKLGVRCCESTHPNATIPMNQYGCSQQEGQCREGCKGKNWEEALGHCAGQSFNEKPLTLCTRAQLQAGIECGTGCRLDKQFVWTLDVGCDNYISLAYKATPGAKLSAVQADATEAKAAGTQ